MSSLSVIPAANSVCLTIPVTTGCRIDFTGQEACDELLKLKADFGEVTEQGILPLVFTHENVVIRAFEEREEVKQYAESFKKACQAAQDKAKAQLHKELLELKKDAIEAMVLEIKTSPPIVLDEVRTSTKSL